MGFYHYTQAALPRILKPRAYKQTSNHKPDGLWLSVDGEWEDWCKKEQFHLESLTKKHTVTFQGLAILWITTPEALERFTEQYGEDSWNIRWDNVTKDYDGIVISPYQWRKRCAEGTRWYYSWDCASACLWRWKPGQVVVDEAA